MAIAQYWQRGESIDFKNDGTVAIKHGDVIPVGNRIGIAGCDILPGAMGSLHVTGVFIMPKATGAVTLGDELYWDTGSANITATAGSNVPAGWAVAAAAAGDATIYVKIG